MLLACPLQHFFNLCTFFENVKILFSILIVGTINTTGIVNDFSHDGLLRGTGIDQVFSKYVEMKEYILNS